MFALITQQGTACGETGLCAKHFTPENKTEAEHQTGITSDLGLPNSWTDCGDNDAIYCVVCGEGVKC
ncbi:hypothetical protein LCGC14_0143110 [marine sediment metagenome]|uniref:Uncharacterized protein n=1 Tax=marine sediment metagenome TaxID=412755 RepID=A0A0F9V4Y7_9ZZZZ